MMKIFVLRFISWSRMTFLWNFVYVQMDPPSSDMYSLRFDNMLWLIITSIIVVVVMSLDLTPFKSTPLRVILEQPHRRSSGEAVGFCWKSKAPKSRNTEWLYVFLGVIVLESLRFFNSFEGLGFMKNTQWLCFLGLLFTVCNIRSSSSPSLA